jgi:hybrid cluster-associated redox disulfide protein
MDRKINKMKGGEKMPNKITEEMTLIEILNFPRAREVLEKHSLPCLHCPMAAFELGTLRIGEVAKMYGIDLKSLLDDLNKAV